MRVFYTGFKSCHRGGIWGFFESKRKSFKNFHNMSTPVSSLPHLSLISILKVLEFLDKQLKQSDKEVVIYSPDSAFIKNAIHNMNHWSQSDFHNIQHAKLWRKIFELSQLINITWKYLKSKSKTHYKKLESLLTSLTRKFNKKITKPSLPANRIFYTDGGYSPLDDIGSWGFVEKSNNTSIIEASGAICETTNNRMEMLAAIKVLELVQSQGYKKRDVIRIVSDSQYLVYGMKEHLKYWKEKDFHKIKNKDLWLRLDELSRQIHVDWCWVKGHSGDQFNTRADKLCGLAMASMKGRLITCIA